MAKYRALALLVLMTGVAQADIYSYKAPDGSIVFTDEPTAGARSIKVEKPMTVPAIKVPRASTELKASEIETTASQPMWPEPAATIMPKSSPDSVSEEVPAYDDSANTSWSSNTQGITSKPKSSKRKLNTLAVSKVEPTITRSSTEKKTPKKQIAAYSKLRILTPTAGSSQWLGGELTVQLDLQPPLQPEHVISLRYDGREVNVGPEMQIVVPDVARGAHTLQAAVLDVDSGKQLLVSQRTKFQIHRPSVIKKPHVRSSD